MRCVGLCRGTRSPAQRRGTGRYTGAHVVIEDPSRARTRACRRGTWPVRPWPARIAWALLSLAAPLSGAAAFLAFEAVRGVKPRLRLRARARHPVRLPGAADRRRRRAARQTVVRVDFDLVLRGRLCDRPAVRAARRLAALVAMSHGPGSGAGDWTTRRRMSPVAREQTVPANGLRLACKCWGDATAGAPRARTARVARQCRQLRCARRRAARAGSGVHSICPDTASPNIARRAAPTISSTTSPTCWPLPMPWRGRASR